MALFEAEGSLARPFCALAASIMTDCGRCRGSALHQIDRCPLRTRRDQNCGFLDSLVILISKS